MADAKISALTSYTPPIGTDVLPIVDVTTSTTKKITIANLLAYIATNLGAIIVTTINKVTITQPASSATLTIANGKTLTANNSLTLSGTDAKALVLTTGLTVTTNDGTLAFGAASKTLTVNKSVTIDGTDSTTMTFPTTSATIARTDAAQTFTGTQTFSTVAAPTNASINEASGTYSTIQTYTPTGGGTATLDLSKGNIHHITMPAGNITIAISNGTAGQCFIIRILQDSGGSRTVAWFTTIKWAGGSAPTLTTTANKADTVGFEVTGSNTYDGFVVGQSI